MKSLYHISMQKDGVITVYKIVAPCMSDAIKGAQEKSNVGVTYEPLSAQKLSEIDFEV